MDHQQKHDPENFLCQIRNMWQFANLCQWIYTFGPAAKIDESISIEDMENECLKANSTVLPQIALALLKLVSSHRGLTLDVLDHQLHKEYLQRTTYHNPFDDLESSPTFSSLDVATKIQVLQQLTQWAMIHPERIRDRMDEQKDSEQTQWRIEPYGWDSKDRTYYVLDDNRVYRLSSASPAQAYISKTNKNGYERRRPKKRRRTAPCVNSQQSDSEVTRRQAVDLKNKGLGSMTWECLAVTLQDVRSLLRDFVNTHDENEKILRSQLEVHLVPLLEKQEEIRKREEQRRERDLLTSAKMANAKRSSRIADKLERQRSEQRQTADKKLAKEAEAAKCEEEQTRVVLQVKVSSSISSREKRHNRREFRRQQHEEEPVQSLSTKHTSDCQLQAGIGRNQDSMLGIDLGGEEWLFDCLCGIYGKVDDGTHSIACENCNVWQHSRCVGVSEEEADRPDFEFRCTSCNHQNDDTNCVLQKARIEAINSTGNRRFHIAPSREGMP